MRDYLLPKLEEYKEYLQNAGVTAEMSMDVYEIPGLMVLFEGMQSVFVTFIEGSDDEPEVMRITAESTEGKKSSDPEDIRFVNFLISAEEVADVDKLRKYTGMLLGGVCYKAYPKAELVAIDESDEPGTELNFSDNAMMLMPRTNALTAAILREGAQDAETGVAKIPFSLVVDGDYAFVAAYESFSDNEYLLHFRTDIAYSEEDKERVEQIVDAFNEGSFFTRCSLGEKDLGLFGDEEPFVVTLHAVTVDTGAIKDDSFYGFFASLFENEVGQFLDMFLEPEEEE